MNSVSSESIGSAGQSAFWWSIMRWYQRSLPSMMCSRWGSPGRFLTMMTCSTLGQLSSALSALCLSGTTVPRRQPPSAVTSTLHPESLIRSASASEEKPPKMTL